MINLMINKKKYLNISDVSKMLQIKEHKIRYWDSLDPKTNKYRVEGISTKSKGGTRYFNRENINKLQKLKNTLYDGNNHNYSINLAEKIISSKNTLSVKNDLNIKKFERNLNKKVSSENPFKVLKNC